MTVCNPYSIVNVLSQLWRREIPGKAMEQRVFRLPHENSQMKSFIEKYDRNQQQLQTLAAMDDLLSGNVYNPASVTCTIFPRSDAALE